MKIGLMGGTFDPIHNMHINLALKAKEQYGLNKVIFMTSGNPPHKTGVSEAGKRHKMTELAISGIKGLEACDYEVRKNEYSYSAETLKWLKSKNPDDSIYFIIGEDSLSNIEKWYRPKEIIKQCILLVYPRKSMETLKKSADYVKSSFGGDIRIIDAPVWNISSTEIREAIRNGEDISDEIPPVVLDYIRENNLYGGKGMDYKSILKILKETLPEKRYLHSLSVAETAKKLAKRFECDEDKAYLAGLVHDCAKRWQTGEQAKIAEEYGLELDENDLRCPAVIHAPLGAEVAKREFGICDEEVLNAVRSHTVGGRNMTKLDKIIYLADMIEPLRKYDGVEKIRKKKELDDAMLEALEQSIEFNIKKGVFIHPFTLFARNGLLEK